MIEKAYEHPHFIRN